MEDKKRSILKGFDLLCEQIHREIELNRPNRNIYHYTSFHSLVKILESRTILNTDYKYFNDPSEIRYGQQVIREVIEDAVIPHKEVLKNILCTVFEEFSNNCNIYVSCYSAEINKLALWRYYANNGTGFAIAFNNFYYEPEANSPSNVNIRELERKSVVAKVEYGESAKALIEKFINGYLTVLNRARTEIGNGDFLRELDKRLIAQLISILPSLKDDSFSDENEIRIYWQEGELFRDQVTNQSFYFPEDRKAYIPIEPIDKNKFPFVNYICGTKPALKSEQFEHKEISEIWIGPGCEFNEAKKAIQEKLNEFGYRNVEIKRCQLPFKSL